MSEINTIILDIYGFRIEVQGDPCLVELFDKHYGHFRVQKSEFSDYSLRISPYYGHNKLPIRVKGGRGGIIFNSNLNNGNEYVDINYNNFIEGTDYNLIVSYVHFLMHWDNKCQAHAATIARKDLSYVFFSPQNTGKTTLVMYLLEKGFDFVADDWVILDDRGQAYLYPQPIRIYDYNLALNMEWCRKFYGWKSIFMQQVMKYRMNFKKSIVPRIPNRIIRYGAEWILSHPIGEIPIDSIENKIDVPTRISRAFWLQRTNKAKSIQFKPISIDEMVHRIISTYLYEFSEYIRWYNSQAQLGNRICYIDNLKEHIQAILNKALSQIECMTIEIPTDATPNELGKAVIGKIEK